MENIQNDIDSRLIDYDDNYRKYDVTDITWTLGTNVPYLVDNGDIIAIVIVPTEGVSSGKIYSYGKYTK